MILALRTDSAEVTIALYTGPHRVDRIIWPAGRKLSDQLLRRIEELLERNQSGWQELEGIIVYKGPGSFTGLRIGITVANTAAYALGIPVVGASGEDWVRQGSELLHEAKPGVIVLPEYGAEANITKPRK